jgi:hypothetical protein
MTGTNKYACCGVVLRHSGQVAASIAELQGAAMFDRKIRIWAVDKIAPRITPEGDRRFRLDLRNGWHATQDPRLLHVRIREHCMTYPSDVFAPLREGRRLALDNAPDQYLSGLYPEIYRLLHDFDDQSISRRIKYVPRTKNLSGWMVFVGFATREQADEARQLDGSLIGGRKVRFAVAKPSLNYTISCDSGRSQGHYSERDTGSAVGTNFEDMQEKIYRKWILSHKDRKVRQTHLHCEMKRMRTRK